MLRGAIDVVTHSQIAGWMASPTIPLRGQTILAFVGAECIGSGSIDIVRPDLLWLVEDGCAGFSFPIELSPKHDTASVVVRLKGCEAVIIQADAEVVRRFPKNESPQEMQGHVASSTPALIKAEKVATHRSEIIIRK